ncbi:MAG: DUF1566 domain-containing protein [Patescibacteria group bacterium]|jgi:hypothetical protein
MDDYLRKIKKVWQEFIKKPWASHVLWSIFFLIVVLLLNFFHQRELKQIDINDFNRGRLMTEQGRQYVDDRSLTAISEETIEKEQSVWEEINGSPFKKYSEINYQSNGQVINLSSGMAKKDNLTGLIWSSRSSEPLSDNFTLNEDGNISGGEAVDFCQALNKIKYAGYNNWNLPTQKQLMQAYVDGASVSLAEIATYFWSGTEFLGDSSRAWRVNLRAGDVASSPKNNSSTMYAVCVAGD